MKITLIGLLVCAAAMAQDPPVRPDPFVGTFEGQQVVLELKGTRGEYAGSMTVQGLQVPVTVKANGASGRGSVAVNGQSHTFTLSPLDDGFNLAIGGQEYRLTRRGSAAATQTTTPAAAGGSAGSIVGTWRNSKGYAKFNADGTGVVDGNPGRYEVQGNQLTLIAAEGRATLPFSVRGDTLLLTVNGTPVAMTREKEQAPGVAGVRLELVGKWCWVSVTTAQQGARQSSRCITLNGNGSYLYEGLTDSYNPNGGATSESSDSGTWEATEGSLTARSRSGKVTTYRLEKRNHPKNVRDPMIVLDGQTFVTFYKKPPW